MLTFISVFKAQACINLFARTSILDDSTKPWKKFNNSIFFFSPFSATMISCIPHLIHDSGMLKVRELLKPQKMEYGSGVRSSIESTRWHIETTQSRVRSVLTPGGVNSCLSRGCESAL